MDIGNSSAKIPLADFETLVSFFFCNLTGNFCTKFGFTTIWSRKIGLQVAQDFGTLLSRSFRQDFWRISFRWRSWNMIWRETSEGGRRILEGFWGASNIWAICSGLENCWAICSGLFGTYAWCLSFFFWWPISRKVGFDERWGLQRARCIGGFHRALRKCTSPMRWVESWVGNKSTPCVFPKPCQVKKHLDDMVEKEKKEASDEGHEAPRPLRFWFHRNPKGEILQKSVQELCRGHDEKEPLQPGFRNVRCVVGHWAFGVGVGSFWLKGVANPWWCWWQVLWKNPHVTMRFVWKLVSREVAFSRGLEKICRPVTRLQRAAS